MSIVSLVWSATAFSATQRISAVSSRMTIRSSGAASTISEMTALASVVLPDPVPPGDHDVEPGFDRVADDVRLARRHYVGRYIVIGRDQPRCAAADAEGRPRDDGRQQFLKPMPADRQLAADDRLLVVCLGLQRMRNAADDDLCCGGGHFADSRDSVAEPFYEEPAGGIEHDLDHTRVVECYTDLIAKRLLQLADKPGVRAELAHSRVLHQAALVGWRSDA